MKPRSLMVFLVAAGMCQAVLAGLAPEASRWGGGGEETLARVRVSGSLPHAVNTLAPTPTGIPALSFFREPHLDRRDSAAFNIPLPAAKTREDVLHVTTRIRWGNTTPQGDGQVSSEMAVSLGNTGAPSVVQVILSASRYNRDRTLTFPGPNGQRSIPVSFPVDTWMDIDVLVYPAKGQWVYILSDEYNRIAYTRPRPLGEMAAGALDTLGIQVRALSRNDGLLNSIQGVEARYRSEADVDAWLRGRWAEQPACSTFPRAYEHVNTEMYNTAFTSLVGNNLIDRMALADPANAEQHAAELAELGFTGALYNGRHFRSNYVEEFPLIQDYARTLIEACHAHGLKVIDHYQPTILNYRAYPLMLNNLHWLSRDLRSGESSFWVCINNPSWRAFFLDYFTENVRAGNPDGIMIDEISFNNEKFCGCRHCREAFRTATGTELPPDYTGSNPGPQERRFGQWRTESITRFKTDILHAAQSVRPDTVWMNYSSDFSDPHARLSDLPRSAAAFSAFVGWESMAYDPLNNWRSYLRALKFRNSYGDFYNIPMWNLARETVTREAAYLAWALSQGTRHSLWYASRLPLDSPEDQAYFKRYNLWEPVMPHQYARGLASTGLLISFQTRQAVMNRNHFWTDLCGWADAFLLNNHQFNALLDGDLFYENRLEGYDTLFLISQSSLSDTQCQNLVDWVEAGGTAVITRHTSLFDEGHARRDDFALSPFMNVSHEGTASGAIHIQSRNPGLHGGFSFSTTFEKVQVIDSELSEVQAVLTDAEGQTHPLIVETAWGKGRFLYVAADLGTTNFELERRRSAAYNSTLNPDVVRLVSDLFSLAQWRRPPLEADLPENVTCIAQKQMDGPENGTVYAHLYNLTGRTIQAGERSSYGVPEPMHFPPIREELIIRMNEPCDPVALWQSPDYPEEKTVVGIRQDDHSTVFSIPGAYLEVYGQLKIRTALADPGAIREPPLALGDEGPAAEPVVQDAPIDVETYYEPPDTSAQLGTEVRLEAGAMTLGDAPLLMLGNVVIFEKDSLGFSTRELGGWMSEHDLTAQSQRSFSMPEARGLLTGGRAADEFPWVREIATRDHDTAEITFAGTITPRDHGAYCSNYRLYIPVETLAGMSYRYSYGMHRSGHSPRSGRITGEEEDGEVVMAHIRHAQFTGRGRDFFLDMCPMGPWGMFKEDLSTAYKGHLIREGEYYVLTRPHTASTYGGKLVSKTVIRVGRYDIENLHPMNHVRYQLHRPATVRLQFTEEEPMVGFTPAGLQNHAGRLAGFTAFGLTPYRAAQGAGWTRLPARAELSRTSLHGHGPLFDSGVRVSGPAAFRVDHPDGILLLNVLLAGPSQGRIRAGGEFFPFTVEEGERETLLVPVWVRDGRLDIEIEGAGWTICGLVLQPLLYAAEDFLFARSWWNSGISPWLRNELVENPVDWRDWSDIPFRKARWIW